jgi:hypothetical protein
MIEKRIAFIGRDWISGSEFPSRNLMGGTDRPHFPAPIRPVARPCRPSQRPRLFQDEGLRSPAPSPRPWPRAMDRPDWLHAVDRVREIGFPVTDDDGCS